MTSAAAYRAGVEAVAALEPDGIAQATREALAGHWAEELEPLTADVLERIEEAHALEPAARRAALDHALACYVTGVGTIAGLVGAGVVIDRVADTVAEVDALEDLLAIDVDDTPEQ